jgi:hypothetical protein
VEGDYVYVSSALGGGLITSLALRQGEQADAAALSAWSIAGPELLALVEPLKQQPGVKSVAALGITLHVAGDNDALLQAALAPWRGSGP